ncbi:60S acidic ribosomal protein P2, partial [Trichinella patagoniensis]
LKITKMKYTAAYCLAVIGGKSNPEVADLKKIITSATDEFDESKAKMVVDSCKGNDLLKLIAEGATKLSSVPSGPAVATGGASVAADAAAPAATESKKEDSKKKEESEEEDEDMGFGLFD